MKAHPVLYPRLFRVLYIRLYTVEE